MEEPKENYCLKWSEFQTNLTNTFDQLRKTEDFVDVTLSVGGKSLKCHKVSNKLSQKTEFKGNKLKSLKVSQSKDDDVGGMIVQ